MQNSPVLPFNQRIRLNAFKIGGLILIPLLFVIQPRLTEDSIFLEVLEVVGMFLMIACVLGRLWATLYVGGHKNKKVVTDGPYSITRNPLYFFSVVGTLGIGLMFGMLSFAAILTLVVGLILYFTAKREQAFLEAEYGADYKAYAARVPMFLPDPSLFTTAPVIEVRPRVLRRNLRDAFIFLMAFPLLELVEVIHERFDIVLFSIF